MPKLNSSLSSGVRVAAVSFLSIAILASISQSAIFLSSQGAAQGHHVTAILLLVSLAVIGGGVVLGRIAGAAIANNDPGWIPGLCIVVYLAVAFYSVVTSTAQIIDAGHATVSHENSGSTRAQNLESQIAANLASIQSYQNQINKADPVRWKTRRDGWANKIESIQRQNMVLMGQRDRVRESSTAKSYQDMQSMFGLSRQGWALLIGLLLELIPFALNLVLGYYSQQQHNASASGKKSQGLRLVA